MLMAIIWDTLMLFAKNSFSFLEQGTHCEPEAYY